jgi:hypothetical protein
MGMGNIYVTPTITAGTALISATPSTEYADLVVAQDVKVETEILEKSQNLFGRVFEALVPRVKQDVAFCKLSDI